LKNKLALRIFISFKIEPEALCTSIDQNPIMGTTRNTSQH
jgi:hypothetical protein